MVIYQQGPGVPTGSSSKFSLQITEPVHGVAVGDGLAVEVGVAVAVGDGVSVGVGGGVGVAT